MSNASEFIRKYGTKYTTDEDVKYLLQERDELLEALDFVLDWAALLGSIPH